MNELIKKQDAIDAVETIGFDFSNCDLSQTEREELCEAIGEVRQTFVRRISYVTPAQQWIPVTERLPEKGEKVLASTKNTVFTQVFKGIQGTPNSWWWNNNTIKTIYAWMPLPKPYEGDR